MNRRVGSLARIQIVEPRLIAVGLQWKTIAATLLIKRLNVLVLVLTYRYALFCVVNFALP